MFSARRSINDMGNLPTFNSFSNKVFQNTSIEEEELTILDDTFDFLDINAKLVFRPSTKNRISVSTLLVDNSLNYANEDSEAYGTRDQLELINNGLSVFWDYQPNESWIYKSSIKYSEFKI